MCKDREGGRRNNARSLIFFFISLALHINWRTSFERGQKSGEGRGGRWLTEHKRQHTRFVECVVVWDHVEKGANQKKEGSK